MVNGILDRIKEAIFKVMGFIFKNKRVIGFGALVLLVLFVLKKGRLPIVQG